MNNTRRKQIQNIINRLEDLKSDVDLVKEDEDTAFNNLPEALQYSSKGENMENIIYNLEDAFDSIESAIEALASAME